MNKKVFVSGCFDLFHSGHLSFFEEASKYGDLIVAIGSDKTIEELKGRRPVVDEKERLYLIKAIRYVSDAFISSGSGVLDFDKEIREIKPDIFITNEDGNYKEKENLCGALGIQYKILRRKPHEGLTPRSSTAIKQHSNIPYRIDLAGSWLDQPYVSKYHPGNVLTISIEPTIEFNDRSGMASSTRQKAIELWQNDIPSGNFEKLAKTLFCFDNPPGTTCVSGAQDSMGIVMPGLNKAYYDNHYWPTDIVSITNGPTLDWLEECIYLVPLFPRHNDYDVLSDTYLDVHNAKALAYAADGCWDAILSQDIKKFGAFFKKSFEAQIALFPRMVDSAIMQRIHEFADTALGWKVSGAGGGGYLILISEAEVKSAIRIKIRRKSHYELS
jgi:cytidyltransferase-like protein